MADDMRHADAPHAHLSETPLRALTRALLEAANNIGKNKQASCAHSLGYLKNRPKGSPIPDECLTCSRILKCM